MPQITLPEDVFATALSAAREQGMPIDSYISQLVRDDFLTGDETETLSMTPELLRSLNEAEQSIQDGHGISLQQLDEDLRDMRERWIQANPR